MKKVKIKLSAEAFNQAVVEAVNEFNFENVYKYLKLVDWEWKSLNDDGYIPSPKMLKRRLVEMFDKLER